MKGKFYKINGALVKKRLFEQGLYQWQLAQSVGIAEPYLSKVLRGQLRVSDKFRKKLAGKLGVSANAIVA